MPRSKNFSKAFAPAQQALIRLAPFKMVVWEGRVMGNYPAGVKPQVLTSCLQKQVLTGTPDGIHIVYHLTDFGKQVLTLMEAYDKKKGKTNTTTQGEPNDHDQPD